MWVLQIGSATLHGSGLLCGLFCFSEHIIPQRAGRSFYNADPTHSYFAEPLDVTRGEIQRTPQNSMNPCLQAILCRQPPKFMQL